MKRIFLVVFLGFFLASALPLSSSMAAAKPGGKCPILNKTTTIKSGGTSKQYKCLIDRTGANAWILVPKPKTPKTLEASKSTSDRLSALNNLGLGNWKQTDNQGFNAQVFISTWPCIIYMAGDLNSAVEIFNNKVNLNSYSGFWVGIQSQGWVVNQPYYDDKTCVRYFARKYGGRIYNVGTQTFEG